jgi:hypothetical protein
MVMAPQPGHIVSKEFKDYKDHKVVVVYKDVLAPKEHKAFKVVWDFKDYKDLVDQWAYKDFVEFKASKDLRDVAFKDYKVSKVPMEYKVFREHQEVVEVVVVQIKPCAQPAVLHLIV